MRIRCFTLVVALTLSLIPGVARAAQSPPQRGRIPAVPGRSGTVVVHTRNRFSSGSVRDMLIVLEDSEGLRDSMMTDGTGVAVFHHVRPGPAMVWSVSRWSARDSIVVVAYRTTLDTLVTSRRGGPAPGER